MAITWQHLPKKPLCYRICGVLNGDPGVRATIGSTHSDTSSNEDEQRYIHTSFFLIMLSHNPQQSSFSLLLVPMKLYPHQPGACSFRPELLFGQLKADPSCVMPRSASSTFWGTYRF